MIEERRRATDPLIQELLDEVRASREQAMANHAEIRQFREDIRPIKEFMQDVTAAKKAAIWMVGIFAAMGAAVTWIINLKSHVETHIK